MMPSPGPGGFLGLGGALRSLTMSPIDSVLQQVHRQARGHLEAGGVAVPAIDKAKPLRQVGGDFYLPADVDPEEIDREIRSKPSGSGSATDNSEFRVLERKAGGRVVVPAAHLLRLGDGDFAKGRKYMHGLLWGYGGSGCGARALAGPTSPLLPSRGRPGRHSSQTIRFGSPTFCSGMPFRVVPSLGKVR
jgi:hypothetical protein